MADGDESSAAHDAPDAPPEGSGTHDAMVIEGLRPPLTRAQRLRRLSIAALAIAGVLAVVLWPVISSLPGAFSAVPPTARATATSSFSWRSQGGVTVIGVSTVDVTTGTANPIPPMCPVTPQSPSSLGLPEMHADTIGGGDVWALLLNGAAIPADHSVKIIWRVTGSGVFQVVARDDAGGRLLPLSGPTAHSGGSNWERPGEEWGTVFNFPRPGCWQLQATRGTDLTASIWLAVSA